VSIGAVAMANEAPGPAGRGAAWARFGAGIGALWRDRRGVTAVMTAVGGSMLIGFAGLAIDVAMWEANKRSAQGAADQAVIAAAIVQETTASPLTDAATTAGRAIAAQMGFVHTACPATTTDTCVDAHMPPTSGTHTTDPSAIEVIITAPQTQLFSLAFLAPSSVSVAARSVAIRNGTGACIVALAPSGPDGVLVNGGATIDASTCNVYDNSGDSRALEVSGAAILKAKNAYIRGNYISDGTFTIGGTLKCAATPPDPRTPPCTGSATMPSPLDPYASRTAPTPALCPSDNNGTGHEPTTSDFVSRKGNYNAQNGTTIFHGTYCGGITINVSSVTMNPGIYILTDDTNTGTKGSFIVSGSGASVSGTGVTIYLTGNTLNNGAVVNIQGGSTATLTAPTSGATAGIVFWNAGTTSGPKNQVTGSSVSITGAIYAPSEEVDYTGGSSAGTGCTQIVAQTVQLLQLLGGSFLQHNCDRTGVSDPIDPSAKISLRE
jgi:Flp pilus assembly protein TadG